MLRRTSSRKARDRKIEAAPEEVHRADFAQEAGAKILEHAIDLDERPPEPVDCIGLLEACLVSCWNGTASGTSFGMPLISVRTRSSSVTARKRALKSATVIGSSAKILQEPSSAATASSSRATWTRISAAAWIRSDRRRVEIAVRVRVTRLRGRTSRRPASAG